MKLTTVPIPVPAAFSFDETYQFLARFSNECLHYASDNTILKPVSVAGQDLLLHIEPKADAAPQLTFLNAVPTAAAIEAAQAYIRDWWGLNTDLDSFYAFAAQDKVLATLVQQYPGVRIIGIPDLFEALCWAIIGQQINLTFAFTLKKRFVERWGRSFSHDGRQLFLHPAAQVIAATKPEDYVDMQFNRRKAEYLIGAAKAIADGSLSATALAGETYTHAHQQLCKIRGIGSWTASYVLMKCFHFPEALPIEDAGLLNALKKNYGLATKPATIEAAALTAGWGQHAALATFYMWRSLAP